MRMVVFSLRIPIRISASFKSQVPKRERKIQRKENETPANACSPLIMEHTHMQQTMDMHTYIIYMRVCSILCGSLPENQDFLY